MGNPAGVKRDFAALEKRRMKAIGLLEKTDLNQSEVARRFHVCRQTVSRWFDEFTDGGRVGLQKADLAASRPFCNTTAIGTPSQRSRGSPSITFISGSRRAR